MLLFQETNCSVYLNAEQYVVLSLSYLVSLFVSIGTTELHTVLFMSSEPMRPTCWRSKPWLDSSTIRYISVCLSAVVSENVLMDGLIEEEGKTGRCTCQVQRGQIINIGNTWKVGLYLDQNFVS